MTGLESSNRGHGETKLKTNIKYQAEQYDFILSAPGTL